MKTSKRILSAVIAVIMVFSCFMTQSLAAHITRVSVPVIYGQTEARTMLGAINEFRTGSDAWYWNETNTKKVSCTGLKKIVYDYDLEKAAMQRAAELVVSYSHTRPDGTPCFTAYESSTGAGENIAIARNTLTTASQAFVLWQENDEDYSGQGHRRNMLNKDFGAIGIGYATYKNYTCWVQEFRGEPLSTTKTAANDSSAVVPVDVLDSEILSETVNVPNQTVVLEDTGKNKTAALPEITGELKMKHTWVMENINVGVLCEWTSSDETIVKISDGKAVATGEGKATVTAVALGETITLPVTVKGTPGIKGDINNDGTINSSDALLALQCSVGRKTLTAYQTARADVDGNKTINSSDALKILQYTVGSIKTL